MNGGPPIDPRILREWTGKHLSEHQLAAAAAPLEPGLIVAGAGTGKTTVMAARVTWLVGTGQVRPDEILGLTFTTKAAAELAGRVRTAVARARDARRSTADDGEAGISTYHSFANSLVMEFGSLVGAEPSSRVLSEAALRQLAMRVLCRTTHEFEGAVGGLHKLVADLVALDGALAEHDVDPEELLGADRDLIERMAAHAQQATGTEIIGTARRRRDLAALVLELRAEKQRILAIDFADQLRWASTLAQQHALVAGQMRDRYRVVLLDEYQDTSVSQRRLMQSLFGEGHPVTAVGDPFQAIYGFRGASVRNIEDFPTHFPVVSPEGSRAPAPRYELTENRRSRQAILDVANAVSAPLRAQMPFPPLVSAAERNHPTEFITCGFFDSEADEFDWVAEQILAVRAAGGDDGAGRHDWGDITVLLRAMTKVGGLRDALTARGIPVEVVGVEGLISLPEVVEVISVLRLLHDPTANPDCARLLTGPRWRIGPRDLRLLGRRAADLAGGQNRRRGLGVNDTLDEAVRGTDPADLISLLDALDDLGDTPVSAEARERMLLLSQELRTLRRHVGEPLGDLVQRVLDTTGFEAELRAQPVRVGGHRLASLHAFTALASEFRDLDGRSTLGSFLRFLADAARFGASPEGLVPSASSSVRIMSAHKSKGLEFPVVVLPSLMEQTFPTRRSLETWPTAATAVPFAVRHEEPPVELAGFPAGPVPTATEAKAFRAAVRDFTDLEETRLAYVAVTRAETTLIASGSRWALSGTATPREPSRFLITIAEQCRLGLGSVAYWSSESDHETNPHAERDRTEWPPVDDPLRTEVRVRAADRVRGRIGELASIADCAVPDHDPDGMVAGWDRDLAALLEEAARDGALEREVRLPESLSTTALQRLAEDEQAFALALARPMPVQPSPAARRGTAFHAWVESLWGEQPLLGADELPGAADADIASDDELRSIQETFLSMPYVAMAPVALEAPFALVLAGRVVPGRIDAVFEHPHPSGDDGLTRWEVVDWKTSRSASADPLQLAIYRLAWAETLGVDPSRVDASFVYVRLGEVQRFGEGAAPLPDRAEIERVLTGE